MSANCIDLTQWLMGVDAVEGERIKASEKGELVDAFARELAFGTGGMRGKLGDGPNRLNRWTVGRVTQGLANWLNGRGGAQSMAICYDSRHGSREFARRAAEVFSANGIRVLCFPRVEPTPVLSFAVRDLGCSGGVMITASHNPREYNGYKVYGSDGCQITVGAAKEIQAEINGLDYFNDVKSVEFNEGVKRGVIEWVGDELLDRYIKAVLAQSTHVDCSGLRVAYTPLNGTGLEAVSHILREIGITDFSVVSEQAQPNGDFPTCPKPNPEESAALELGIALGSKIGADVLLATDPDADRLGIAVPHADEWKLLTGNELGILLLDFLASRAVDAGEQMPQKVAITTIVSAPMADDLAREYGFELRRTLTGFKFCGEQIGLLEQQGRERDFLFGLEESYGYLAGTYVRDKDSVVACMLTCELVAFWKERGLDLWEAMQSLYSKYGYWGNRQVSIAYEGAEGAERMASIMAKLRGAQPVEIGGVAIEAAIDYKDGASMPTVNPSEAEAAQVLPSSNVLEWRLSGGSRVLVRPSGTEPKIKAYVFARGETLADAEALLNKLAADVQDYLA